MISRVYRLAPVAGVAVLVAACGESTPERVEAPSGGEQAEVATTSAAIAVAEFTASFSATTGEFTFDVREPSLDGAWAQRALEQTEDGLVTVPQALYCPRRAVANANAVPNAVSIGTVVGSVQRTFSACGVTAGPLISEYGILCADVQLVNGYTETLRRPMAMITEIPAGYEGFRFIETNGEIGVDPTTLGGTNPPTDLTGGLFGWSQVLPNRARSLTKWAFRNPGGSFEFNGVVLAESFESCNGVDDDCDDLVDEGAGCFAEGDDCETPYDCASGTCTGGGECGPSTYDDTLKNGTESDNDCGGACELCENGDTCNTNADCASGACNAGVCAQYRLPVAGEIVFTEYMARTTADPGGEWLELANVSNDTLDITGCYVRDNNASTPYYFGSHTIAPGEHFLLANSSSTVTNFGLPTPLAVYGTSLLLSNTADQLYFVCGDDTVDFASYVSGEVLQGRSNSLHNAAMSATANNAAVNWCKVGATYGTAGFTGTPGAANPSCDATISACALDGTDALTVTTGGAGSVQALVNAPGLTNLTTGLDANARVKAEFGYGPVGSNPETSLDWVWFTGAGVSGWNDTAAPGRDAYSGSIVAPDDAGEQFAIGARVSGNNGGTYTQCAGTRTLDVIAPLVPPSVEGEVIITEIMPDPGNVQTGEYFELYNTTATAFDLEGCTINDNSASHVIAGTLIVPAGGYAVIANSSNTSVNFGLTAFDYAHNNVLQLGNGSGGDFIVLTCGGEEITRFTYTGTQVVDGVAFQVDPSKRNTTDYADAGNWCPTRPAFTYGDSRLGTPGEANPACYPIDFCRLQSPASLVEVSPNGTTEVTGRLGIDSLTDSGPGNLSRPLVIGEVGVGADGSDPSVDPNAWTWTTAATNPVYSGTTGEADYDEYIATLTHPAAGGALAFDYAYRFSGDGGDTWTYCDSGTGSTNGYSAFDAGQMSLAETYEITRCGILHSGNGTVTTGRTGDAQFFADVATTAPALNHATIDVEIGIGRVGTAATDWAYMPGSFSGSPTNAWQGTLDIGQVTNVHTEFDGEFGVGFRCSADGGATWTYGDISGELNSVAKTGSADGESNPLTLAVNGYSITDCVVNGHTAGALELDEAESVTLTVNVAIDGVTGTTTGNDISGTLVDIVVDRGFGDASTAPNHASWGANWTDAALVGGYGSGHASYRAGYDLLSAALSFADAGSYTTAFRVSGDAGATWTYCGANASGSPYVAVTVTEPSGGGGGPAEPCLRISQYLEGSSNNKGVEVWNCGSNEIDLSAYRLRQYNCGSTSCIAGSINTYNLTGTLAGGAVRTYCNSAWALSPACDATSNLAFFSFNGNDPLSIEQTSPAVIMDAIGIFVPSRSHTNNFGADKTFHRTACAPYLGETGTTGTESYTLVGSQNDTTGWGTAPGGSGSQACASGP